MASAIVSVIQQEAQRYLTGQLQLNEFEDFLVPLMWDIDSYRDESATELVGRIHVLLAEYSCRERSLGSLKDELTRIALSTRKAEPSLR